MLSMNVGMVVVVCIQCHNYMYILFLFRKYCVHNIILVIKRIYINLKDFNYTSTFQRRISVGS